jgi:hypothetical protein
MLLDDKTTDPHALAVQNYLHSFISKSVQSSHGDKLDTVCARVDDMAISTASKMQATDDLIQESNARISNLMTTQATQATSLSNLERILLQQTDTLNKQFELVKSIASTRSNESSTATELTLSTPSSLMSMPKLTTDMDVVNSSPQATLKRSRRLSTAEPLDRTDVTNHPELSNYTRRQRSSLFTFLDSKDEFDLKQTLACGYKSTDKYRTHNWPPNDIGLYRCCGPDDEDACSNKKCLHFATAILCDEYNCVNEHCQNRIGSLPMTPEDLVETFQTEHTGLGLRTRF